MEEFFKDWPYSCNNPMQEWSDGTNQYKLRKIVELLDDNRVANDVFKSAKFFFDHSCENLSKNWTHAKEEERAEREKTCARVFGLLIDLAKSGQFKTSENVDNFMDLFNSIAKHHKFILIKVLCMIRLINLLNSQDILKKFDETKMAQLFSAFELHLNPNEYYYGHLVGPWGIEIERFLSTLRGELFIKNISAVQKYFE